MHHSDFFQKFAKKFATHGAQLVSMTIAMTSVVLNHCIVDTSGKFIADVNNTGGQLFKEIYIDLQDAGGKFAVGVNDADSKLPQVSTLRVVNLLLSTETVVNKDRTIRLPTP
jgi:hypothetical protein